VICYRSRNQLGKGTEKLTGLLIATLILTGLQDACQMLTAHLFNDVEYTAHSWATNNRV